MRPEGYIPMAQGRIIGATLLMRTFGDPLKVLPAVKSAIWSVNKDQMIAGTIFTLDRVHDLLRLADLAQLHAEPGQRDTLARMNAYALAGRYPDTLGTSISSEAAVARLAEAKGVFEWLMRQ